MKGLIYRLIEQLSILTRFNRIGKRSTVECQSCEEPNECLAKKQIVNDKQPEIPPFFLRQLAKQYDGKLLLREEIMLQDHIFKELLAHSYFTPLQALRSVKFTHHCQRCGNQEASQFASIPCERCKQTHLYCRKCIEMGRVLACESLYYWSGVQATWPSYKKPCTWQGKLTKAQAHAAQQIVQAIEASQTLLIWAVTGSGKTEMLFPGITKALQSGKRICIATPRADVVRELLPRLKQAFSSVVIQGLYSGSRDNDGTAQLIITTTHQLLRYRHAFDVMIIDEIDAFPYHADPSLPYATNRAKKLKHSTIYLTATPRKEQYVQIKRNKLAHVYVPIRFHKHPLIVPKLIMCYSLKKYLSKNIPPPELLRWLRQRTNKQRQVLIFVPTIQLAEHMCTYLITKLIKEKIITSQHQVISVHAEDKDRAEKIQRFREKEIFILLTTTILERGVTFPAIDVAVIQADHDVFDEAALVQIAGRAGRSPDDPKGDVIFFHQGKTVAIEKAVYSIEQMNKRARSLNNYNQVRTD